MRSLDNPFEQINTEQLVKRIYNWVSPLDSSAPANASITLASGQTQTFQVQVLQPLTDDLDVAWFVDGQPQGAGLQFTVSANALGAGSHTVEAVVEDLTPMVRNDPAQLLEERRRWTVVVSTSPAANLIETAVTNPPGSAWRGGRFAVTDTAKNTGTATAGASTTRYYLSLDTLKNGGDKLLTGSRAVPSLAPAARSSGTVTVTIPTTTTLGAYYLLACADDTNVVAETTEGNNCKASATKVTVNP
jgi:CARDB